MFSITRKMGVLSAVAAVTALASTGVATAAPAIRNPGGTGTAASTHTTAALQGGSAGIPGYDDAKCEQLADDYNDAMHQAMVASFNDDMSRADRYQQLAHSTRAELEDNCLVVD